MAKVDPNIYALEIELSLNDSAATKALKSFEGTAVSVEQQMSRAVSKILTNISQVSTTLDASLSKVGQTLSRTAVSTQQDLAGASAAMQSNIAMMADQMDDMAQSTQKVLGTEGKINAVMKMGIAAFTKFFGDHKKHRIERQKFNQDIAKAYTEEIKNVTKVDDLTEDLKKSIDTKNKSHQEEKALVESEAKAMDGLSKSGKKFANEIEDGAEQLAKMKGMTDALWAAMEKADRNTESFTNQNYRAYGSQSELNNAVRSLRFELGGTEEQATATLRALMDIKVPKDELEEYSKTVMMFNRVSGSSPEQTATFVQSLRAAGYSAKEVEQQLTDAANAMETLGLSGQDVGAFLNQTGNDLLSLKGMLGGSTEEVKKFQQSSLQMMGFAKATGLSTSAIMEMQKALSDPTKLMMFGQGMGMTVKNAADLENVTLEAAKRLEDLQTQIDLANASGDNLGVQQLTRQYEVFAEQNFGNVEASRALVSSLRAQASQLGVNAQAVDSLGKSNEKGKSLAEMYAQATATLTQALLKFQGMIDGTVGPALQFLADSTAMVLNWIHWVINAVSSWIEKNETLQLTLKYVADALAPWVPYIKAAVGALIVFGTAVVFVMTAMKSYSLAAAFFKGSTKAAAQSATMFQRVIAGMGQGIGLAIKGILQGIASGLNFLIKVATKGLPALFALSLLMLSLGAAAYMVALAVQMFATNLQNNIIALIAFAIAFMLVVAAIAILTLLGPIAIAVMIALAVVFVALGAAALMTGLGIQLMGYGFQMMAAAGILSIAIGLGIMTLALFGLTLVALPAVAAITALGGALWWWEDTFKTAGESFANIGIGMMAITQAASVGFGSLGRSVEQLATELEASTAKLSPVAAMLKTAGDDLKNASFDIVIAGAFITSGASSLLAGASLLGAAASTLQISASMMMAAVSLFDNGVNALLASSAKLTIASSQILTAAGILTTANTILTVGLMSLGAAALQMVFIGAGLAASVLRLYLGAMALAKTGFTLTIGALSIFRAANIMSASMDMLGATTRSIGDSIFRLIAALGALKKVELGNLRSIVDDSLAAVPGIKDLSTGLESAAVVLDKSVEIFMKPVDKLIETMTALKTALNSLGSGITLDNDIMNIANSLEQYSSLIEGSSDRISAAINARAIPAMKAAETAGIEEAVKSEAVTTVQIKDNVQGDKQQDAMAVAVEAQTIFYTRVLEVLENMGTSNKEVKEISSLLATYLPAIAKEEGGLSTEFNAWAK